MRVCTIVFTRMQILLSYCCLSCCHCRWCVFCVRARCCWVQCWRIVLCSSMSLLYATLSVCCWVYWCNRPCEHIASSYHVDCAFGVHVINAMPTTSRRNTGLHRMVLSNLGHVSTESHDDHQCIVMLVEPHSVFGDASHVWRVYTCTHGDIWFDYGFM